MVLIIAAGACRSVGQGPYVVVAGAVVSDLHRPSGLDETNVPWAEVWVSSIALSCCNELVSHAYMVGA